MDSPTRRKVAALGLRYGDCKIERDLLEPLGATLVQGAGSEAKDTLALCQDVDVILCGGAPKIPASLIRRLPRLKAIVRAGIGVDAIDLKAATRHGVCVANVPDYCMEEVAAHTLSLILAWARKLPLAWSHTRRGGWSIESLKPLRSLQDSILGLVGFGRIAQRVARMARAAGLQVWATDPYVKADEMRKKGVTPAALEELLRAADFVSLHLPLAPRTRQLISSKRLRLMKPTAYLINTARGELVQEAALQRALEKGRIAGAALDVMENEPPDSRHRLRSMDNVIITPHCAWYTESSQRLLREKACAEVIRVLRGGTPKNLVNPDVLR